MKTAIVGSRSIDHEFYAFVAEHVPDGASEIISGGAAGADRLAERYAAEHNLKMTVIRPDYGAYDRRAPLIRNGQIVDAADYVLVFWDGRSRGSLHVIMTCIRKNKPYRVFLIRKQA